MKKLFAIMIALLLSVSSVSAESSPTAGNLSPETEKETTTVITDQTEVRNTLANTKDQVEALLATATAEEKEADEKFKTLLDRLLRLGNAEKATLTTKVVAVPAKTDLLHVAAIQSLDEATQTIEKSFGLEQAQAALVAEIATNSNIDKIKSLITKKDEAEFEEVKVADVMDISFEMTLSVGDESASIIGIKPDKAYTVTIPYAAAKAGDNYQVLHFDGTDWEALETTVQDGAVVVSMSSFSPVAIATYTLQAAQADTATTTSSNNTLLYVGIGAAIVIIGAFIISKKKKELAE